MIKDKEAMVSRLKKARNDEFEAGQQLGVEIGREWCEQVATPADLRLIATGEHSLSEWNSNAFQFLTERYDAFYPTEWADEMLENLGVKRADELSAAEKGFTAGFVASVAEVWAEVKDQLT